MNDEQEAILITRLERLVEDYDANHLPNHARGVAHALLVIRAYFTDMRATTGEGPHGRVDQGDGGTMTEHNNPIKSSDNLFDTASSAEELISQIIGAGSTCWENLSETGEFDCAFAGKIVDHALMRLKELGTIDVIEEL